MKAVVIGGGIVGVSAALSLAEHGVEVVVLERGSVAGEASGLNAGLIGAGGWGHDPGIDIALRMGSRERYVDLAERRGREFGFESTGTLSLIRTEAEWRWAEAVVDGYRVAGHCHELLTGEELRELEPAADPALLGAIFDPLGARAEPVAATQAFAAEAEAAGATILTGHSVTGLRARSGGGWGLDVAGSAATEIGADVVVIAAGPWCADIGAMVDVRVPVVGVRGQMWATEPTTGPLLRHGIASVESTRHWASDEAPTTPPELTHRDGTRVTRHVYGRQRQNGEIVFGGDRVLTHDRTVDDDGIAVNHGHVCELLPSIGELAVQRTWTGSMPFSRDGRPLLGPVPDRPGLFLAAGLASSGFGRGPMAGQLVADMVLGTTPTVDLSSVLPAGRVTELS